MILCLPGDADRIEAYLHWGRISWNGATCYLAYDLTEYPDWFGTGGEYRSKFGRKFRIDIGP